jgi:signal transduction histidine kinase
MSVQKKLITNVVVVCIATIILGGISYYIIDNLANYWLPEQKEIDQLGKYYLEMRRNEKDFLARDASTAEFFQTGNSLYLDKFEENYQAVLDLLADQREEEVGFGHTAHVAEIDKDQQDIIAYHDIFLQAVSKYRERGGPDLGLLGQLDSAEETLQAEVGNANDVAMTKILASLAHQEQHYLLTRNPVYYDNMLADIASLKSEIQSKGLSTASLESYSSALANIVQLDREIGITPDDGLTGDFREAASRFEDGASRLEADIASDVSEVSFRYIAITIGLAVVIIAFNFGIGTIISRSVSAMVQKIVEHDKKETELREKIEEANKALLETEKAKDEFISMVSHELRTPIVPIKLYTDMLLKTKSIGELNEKQRKALSSIQKGTDRLEMLIGDIFDAYKLDIGKLKFTMKETDIVSLVDQNIAELKSFTAEKEIALKTDIKATGAVWCDSKRVGQVFFNLVKNSVDFAPAKTGEIIIRVEDGVDSMVTFTVQDNGPGIPPEKIDKLFQKFYQVDTSATRKHGGTGLGLAVCKGIIESQGGSIWVDKTFTRGASVKFTLSRRKPGA